MTNTPSPLAATLEATNPTPKQQFLSAQAREFQTTLRVLRAYPESQLDLRPHPKSKTARELGWTFVAERILGIMVFKDEFIEKMGSGESPPPPQAWADLLAALEAADRDYVELIRDTPDADLTREVRFFTAPKTVGKVSRLDWIRFLLNDEIHHRGQFSVYLRMADGKVPSIYGPTADEPWM